MEQLYKKFRALLQHTSLDFKRYLYHSIAWDSRMIGLLGARGVGKTTLLLQYVKENLNPQKTLYVSADDLYFTENKLVDLIDDFYKANGEFLFIDEIHKYPNWSIELKNAYDFYPTLKIVFTGSSVLDLLKGSSDLSRRAVLYTLNGLSFREYLNLYHNQEEQAYSLAEILNNEVELNKIVHPLPLFKDYLRKGYYPFGIESEMTIRLNQVIIQALEVDIPQYANLTVGTSRKLKHLLAIIAESVPFKPNFTKIAGVLGVSRNSLDDYFYYMEKAGLILQLRNNTGGVRGLGKVEKVYLNNANIIYNLSPGKADIGNVLETFFFNQMQVNQEVITGKKADFMIGDFTFEIGGKGKSHTQIDKDGKSFIVKDDIEFGHQNTIPLWAFGLNY